MNTRKKIIASLIECANDLDDSGFFDEADYLTKLAYHFPEDDQFRFDEENPDSLATDSLDLGADQFDTEQGLLTQDSQLDGGNIDIATQTNPQDEFKKLLEQSGAEVVDLANDPFVLE